MFKMKMSLLILAFGLYPSIAYAYLDPSSGSAIVSAVIGVIAAVSFTLKTYWYRLKRLFTGEKELDDSDDDSDADNP
jgi:hypothetical protein|tara:strand:- start:606 stop:836 length:231 start_codon:yes stop_codon:yes gene_type:complete